MGTRAAAVGVGVWAAAVLLLRPGGAAAALLGAALGVVLLALPLLAAADRGDGGGRGTTPSGALRAAARGGCPRPCCSWSPSPSHPAPWAARSPCPGWR